MEKSGKIGLMAQQLAKKNLFYLYISSLQLFSNGKLLPKRLKGDYTCLSQKAFASLKHKPKKHIPNLCCKVID